jgi:pyrimidine deaminase RibD-like protein
MRVSPSQKQPKKPPFLGIYANNSSPSVTARVTADPEAVELGRNSRQARAERFALKWFAHRLLAKDHRTKKCMRWRIPRQQLQVLKGAKSGKAFYHGLQVCASVWSCPICASKISERRRLEVIAAVRQAEALGLKVFLLTLTVPHGLGDDVNLIIKQMTKAWMKLWSGKASVAFKRALGHFGHIRALEVTHGQNGFHPHFHALVFYHPDQLLPGTWENFPALWQKYAARAGLPLPSLDRGCRIDTGDKIAAYVAKSVWGLESELTKGQVKKGKNGSRSPLDLLRDYKAGDLKAGALWSVYAVAFHGKKSLMWSCGLKKLLSLAELTDEEIANQPDDEPARLMALLGERHWPYILKHRLEAHMLDLAETDEPSFHSYLNRIEREHQR